MAISTVIWPPTLGMHVHATPSARREGFFDFPLLSHFSILYSTLVFPKRWRKMYLSFALMVETGTLVCTVPDLRDAARSILVPRAAHKTTYIPLRSSTSSMKGFQTCHASRERISTSAREEMSLSLGVVKKSLVTVIPQIAPKDPWFKPIWIGPNKSTSMGNPISTTMDSPRLRHPLSFMPVLCLPLFVLKSYKSIR